MSKNALPPPTAQDAAAAELQRRSELTGVRASVEFAPDGSGRSQQAPLSVRVGAAELEGTLDALDRGETMPDAGAANLTALDPSKVQAFGGVRFYVGKALF